ncbi:MAG: double-strand break repair protein AddB, partial [Rhodobacteraceae bacterium]|nr:double-strand break repair protein AddB [Paracoccaceae bacterium]
MFHRSGSDHPNLFGLPPGVDFARKALAGLEARLPGSSPEALARVTIFVNTRRMQRRMRQIYDDGPPRLLPRIKLITDLSFNAASGGLAAPAPPLRRQLELTQLISALLDKEPKFAPRAALFDLASSLAELMQEMEGEGVGPEVLRALDVSDSSGHWQRTLDFLSIAGHYLDNAEEAPSREARQRLSVIRLIASWEQTPPADPIIVAGSTGSRGTTVLLLEAVARLPNGAVILPGFDFDMPAPAWTVLDQALTSEDHPQFRFARLCERLNMLPGDVQDWANCAPARPARNALISLSLRPAPVTDQWLADGPSLGDLTEATKGLTLIEAPGPREEAEAIALQLRVALDNGQTAALITPDRMLTRRVAAALDRWQIIPDDSAGLPLALTPPGRFLRHVATLFDRPLTPGPLLALLKHPLCHADVDRGQHVLFSHELELFMRRNGRPRPGPDDIERFVQKTGKDDAVRVAWGQWLVGCLAQTAEQTSARQSLSAHVERHLQLAEALSSGEAKPAAAALWAEAAGRKALIATQELRRHADIGAPLSPLEYSALFDGILAMHEVRDRDKGHPHVLIWGTLEARVQGADLVILGGLNDGIWPQTPKADPWLNRQMRAQAGLLLPERRVGLSAHDYMQAVAGAQVCLSRTIRSEDAPTVPSRWLNRLTNLMEGLPDQNGPKALADMRKAGQDWLDGAAALSAVQKPVAP